MKAFLTLGRRARGQRGVTLIELLVSMIIMGIISTMIILVWSSLQSSYSYTVSAAQSRSTARDTMAHMRREIRDAMFDPTSGEGPIVVAEANHIQIMTAFNNSGGNIQAVDWWYRTSSSTNGSITRQRGTWPAQTQATNVVNVIKGTPLFRYSYLDAAGNTVVASSVSAADVSRILTVEIHILADVNPAHPPIFMDLVSTVQPRNQRQF